MKGSNLKTFDIKTIIETNAFLLTLAPTDSSLAASLPILQVKDVIVFIKDLNNTAVSPLKCCIGNNSSKFLKMLAMPKFS